MKNYLVKIKELKPAQLIVPVLIVILFLGTIIGIVRYQSGVKAKKVPKLEIVSPADGAEVTDAQIIVTGSTSNGVTVTANDLSSQIDKQNNFSVEVPVAEGSNQIIVVAENKAGTKNEKTLNIKRIGAQSTNTSDSTAPKPADAPEAVTPDVAVDASVPVAAPVADGKGNLSSTGPETFWLPEALGLSGAAAAWAMSRRKYKMTVNK